MTVRAKTVEAIRLDGYRFEVVAGGGVVHVFRGESRRRLAVDVFGTVVPVGRLDAGRRRAVRAEATEALRKAGL